MANPKNIKVDIEKIVRTHGRLMRERRAPREYCYYTVYDGENYLVHITVPISKEQFDALGGGADLWKTIYERSVS